MCIALLCIGS